MVKKTQMHNLIILDESGSMESIKNLIISGFNELTQSITTIAKDNPDQDHFVSFVSFNSNGIKWHMDKVPVDNLNTINEGNYKPAAMTPLYDTMGTTLHKLEDDLSATKDCHILVTVLTDGLENASREYDGKAIKALVERLKKGNWTFTYIGADHHVDDFAVSISIRNTLIFQKSEQGVRDLFKKEQKSRSDFWSQRMFENSLEKDSGYFDRDTGKEKEHTN